MEARFEVDKTDEGKALHSHFFGPDAETADSVLEYIEQAPLMPEQRLIVELTVLKRLDESREKQTVQVDVGDPKAYAEEAVREIGEDVRRQRHIGALTGGLALCAMILILRSGTDLVLGLIKNQSIFEIPTALDLGHWIAFLCILASTRILVIGDKKPSYSDPKKVQRRLQFVGGGVIIALAVMAIPYFSKFMVFETLSIYVLLCGVILLGIWKFSAHL